MVEAKLQRLLTGAKAIVAHWFVVPMYKPKKENSTRIEFRSPDTACNPYLAYAVMLAAGLKGVEESMSEDSKNAGSATFKPQ